MPLYVKSGSTKAECSTDKMCARLSSRPTTAFSFYRLPSIVCSSIAVVAVFPVCICRCRITLLRSLLPSSSLIHFLKLSIFLFAVDATMCNTNTPTHSNRNTPVDAAHDGGDSRCKSGSAGWPLTHFHSSRFFVLGAVTIRARKLVVEDLSMLLAGGRVRGSVGDRQRRKQ